MDFSGGKGRLGFGGHIDCHRYGAAGLPGEPGDVAGVTGTTARYLITLRRLGYAPRMCGS